MKPSKKTEGFRERVRRQLRDDIDRVTEEHRRRGEKPTSTLAMLRLDIEDRAPRQHKNARLAFYAKLRAIPSDIQESILVVILSALLQRTATKRQPQQPHGEMLRPDRGGGRRWYRKTRWSVDTRTANTASHLFARLRPVYRSDRATYKAMAEVFTLFLGHRLSLDGVKKLTARSRRS